MGDKGSREDELGTESKEGFPYQPRCRIKAVQSWGRHPFEGGSPMATPSSQTRRSSTGFIFQKRDFWQCENKEYRFYRIFLFSIYFPFIFHNQRIGMDWWVIRPRFEYWTKKGQK